MREFNLFETEGEITAEQLSELITPYPMLSDRKLVIVKESGFLSSYDKRSEELLKNIPEYATVIFTEQLASKVSKKLVKIFEGRLEVVDFSKRSTPELRRWIGLRLKDFGKKISAGDCDEFIQLCGRDMSKIALELDKLCAYTADRDTITAEDIENMLPPDNDYKVYELTDKVLSGRKNEAYRILAELRQEAEPIAVLSGFFNQLHYIAMVKNLKKDGEKTDEFFPANRKFLAKKIASSCGKYSMEQIRQAMTYCAKYDVDIKTGRIDGWTAVELIMAMF